MSGDDTTQGLRRNCPYCGAYVLPGSTRCANGHQCVPVFTSSEYLLSTRATLGSGFATTADGCSIFECRRCERLVESHHPLAGGSVSVLCPRCGEALRPLIGREIEGYRIDELIGVGGFGLVYLASNTAQSEIKAVLKILRPSLAEDRPEFVSIFLDEARHTEALGRVCFNIVRISNVGDDPWPHFFAEYIRGETLSELIDETLPERVPIETCVGFLRGMAKALSATHSHGRVHRDFKPLNIMVMDEAEVADPENRIKVLDFGLSMELAGRDIGVVGAPLPAEPATFERSPVEEACTLEYAPPEFFDGIQHFQGDVYSFGVSAYEVLTGERPWKNPASGRSPIIYWRNCHRKRAPRPLRELRHDVPAWLARVVMKCLEKDPAARIPSAEQLLRGLRAPTPPWVWMVGAAAALIAALVLWRALVVPPQTAIGGWKDEKGRELSGVLWVRRAEDLVGRSVHAHLAGVEQELSWSTSVDGSVSVAQSAGCPICTAQPDASLHVLFDGSLWMKETGSTQVDAEESLSSGERTLQPREIPIFGKPRGVLRRPVRTGRIVIKQDTASPTVSEAWRVARIRGGGEARALEPATRIGGGARLVLRISDDESGVERAELQMSASRSSKAEFPPISGERLHGSGDWSFSLPDGLRGRYDLIAKASDFAGRETYSSKAIVIDADADLELESAPFVVAGRAYFPLRIKEPLTIVGVTKDGHGLEPTVFVTPKIAAPDSIALASWLEALEPSGSSLEKSRPYLLAVPVEALGRKTILDVVLKVEDTSWPPNEGDETFRCAVPPGLARDAMRIVESMSLTVSDKTFPAQLEGPSPQRIELPADTVNLELQEVAIRFEEGQEVLRTACRLISPGTEGSWWQGDHEVFRPPFRLRANARNDLVFEFTGYFEDDPVELRLTLIPDTKPPDFNVVWRSGEEVQVGEVCCDGSKVWMLDVIPRGEALQSVTVKDSETPRTTIGVRRDDGSFEIDVFKRFPREEDGRRVFEVTAKDEAGHVSEKQSIALQQSFHGPSITPVDANDQAIPESKPFPVDTDTLRFQVEDPNGLDFMSPEVQFLRGPPRPGAEPTTLKFSWPGDPPDEKVADLLVDLTPLPDECTGVITLEMRDRCGQLANGAVKLKFSRRESWGSTVPFRGVDWIFIYRPGGKHFYITAREIPNDVVWKEGKKRGFLDASGSYAMAPPDSPGPRPKYWHEIASDVTGDDATPYPLCSPVEDPSFRSGRLPLTGVSAAEAERIANEVFGATLPTCDEYQRAIDFAKQSERGPDSPNCAEWWHSGREGEFVVTWTQTKENDRKLRCRQWMVHEERGSPSAPSSQDPNREDSISPRFLHLRGNVAEIVRDFEGADTFSIVGGNFDTRRDDLDTECTGIDEVSADPADDLYRNYKVGFRMVYDVEGADVPMEFIKKAQEALR